MLVTTPFWEDFVKKNSEVPALQEDQLALGKMLGRREAFAAVAGRCTAAEAAQIRGMRENKTYLATSRSWGEFCAEHLHMSKSNADRIISLLDEFGPQYFILAQITRVSPDTFRAIAPSVRDGALHTNGEAIALIPENAARVSRAVAELRKAAAPKLAPEVRWAADRLTAIEGRCDELVAEFESLAREWRQSDERILLGAVCARTRSALTRLGRELTA
jgi:hypothetical protein